MEKYNERMVNTRQKLDTISPSFCAAKWQQVTLHLGNGTNHSCHHPQVHSFDLDDIKNNPDALHNTKYKKKLRKQMLEGERPRECDYCWRVEDANAAFVDTQSEVFSDRVVKSADNWAKPYIDDLAAKPWDEDVYPTYVEVDFENTCNFKCAYCSPSYSSQWAKEVRDHGHYEFDSDPNLNFNDMAHIMEHSKMPLAPEDNPYIEAFWNWFPEAVKHMQHFRVTGGEPLMSKNLMKVLDYLIANPQPGLKFYVNSNLNPSKALWDKFLEKIDLMKENKSVHSISMFTSCEAHGKAAEYIRFGMDYNVWLKNLETLLDKDIQTTIMSTFNVLSIGTYRLFLEDILKLKKKYMTPVKSALLLIDTPYVRHPEFLAAWLAGPTEREIFADTITWMYQNMERRSWPPLCGNGFFEHEIEQLRRVFDTATELHHSYWHNDKMVGLRRVFYQFVNEYDKRRGTNFLETFPELEEIYMDSKNHYDLWKDKNIPVKNI